MSGNREQIRIKIKMLEKKHEKKNKMPSIEIVEKREKK